MEIDIANEIHKYLSENLKIIISTEYPSYGWGTRYIDVKLKLGEEIISSDSFSMKDL